jgi:hypothetical protein
VTNVALKVNDSGGDTTMWVVLSMNPDFGSYDDLDALVYIKARLFVQQ